MKIEFLETAKKPEKEKHDARVTGGGLVYFSAAIAQKLELKDKNVRIALDQDDPEKKLLYITILPDDTKEKGFVKIAFYKKNATNSFMNKAIALKILNGAKKASLKFVNEVKHKDMTFLVFEITRTVKDPAPSEEGNKAE